MKNILYIAFVILFLGAGTFSQVQAQGRKKMKTNKASLLVNIKTKVVDENGKPIYGAELITSEGAISVFTDKNGMAEFNSKANGTILVEALGYEDVVINIANRKFPKILKMVKTEMYSSGKYLIGRYDGGKTTQKNLVGAVSSIDGMDLATYPEFSLSNTLQGRLAGVVADAAGGGLANNVSSIYVRGQHRKDDNAAIVIVDGIERDWNDLIPEEIEKIEVMKDATAKILYGSRAANGVLVITTKRGEANKRVIKASLEAGAMIMTRTPKYLDSYNYATLYNEARMNDGLPPFYTQQQLEGYKNSTGVNDLFYPNVDFYDNLLHDQSMYRKAVFDLNGGTDKVRYALVANYVGGNGFEKAGVRPDLNRINVRGNLDIKATDFLNVVADGAVRLENRKVGYLGCEKVFTQLSTTRPNEYPFLIHPEVLGLAPSYDGIPYFGASLSHPDNLYTDMQYGGYSQERYIVSQTNLGLDFNLDSILKGLKASGFITFDNYSYFKKGQTNIYPTYAVLGTANGIRPEIKQMRLISEQSNQQKQGDETRRTLGWRGNVSYNNVFGKHGVGAVLAYNYYQKEIKGDDQDIKNSNATLRLNYSFDNKYIVEATGALMGSNRFVGKNRYFMSGAVGAAWVLSNEQFIKQADFINFLKLKASWGLLGYDKSTDYLLYDTAWEDGGTVLFANEGTTTAHYTQFVRIGNPDLKWESSNEYNVGVEGLLFNNRLSFDVNYFNETRSNIIGMNSAAYADVLGTFISYENIGKVKNHGFDVNVEWSDKSGDISYSVGANLLWSKNKLVEWSEVDYNEDYLKKVGQSTDVIMGYEAMGLFGKNVKLDNGVFQTLGNYQEGDIAYKDLNGDKIIDSRDQKAIGNSFPRTSLGVDFNIGYKGWNLYVLGTSEFGLDNLLNNTYFWNKGEGKYSVETLDRYHSVNNPNGTYPRLTTTEGTNNFVNSTYWVEDGSFFRLKNVELSYTFGWEHKNLVCKKIKLFARGTNLFVISKEKNLDPEVINAGVTNYPLYSTVTGGINITF